MPFLILSENLNLYSLPTDFYENIQQRITFDMITYKYIFIQFRETKDLSANIIKMVSFFKIKL